MPIAIHSIDHIVLRTSQIELMKAFYCTVLGCPLERESEPALGLTQLRAGNALIDLITVNGELGKMGGGPPTATENNLDHLCLQLVATTEETVLSHLQECGINAGAFEERYGAEGFGRSIYLADPDGNTVELRIRRGERS